MNFSPCGVTRAGEDLTVIKKTTAGQITYTVVFRISTNQQQFKQTQKVST